MNWHFISEIHWWQVYLAAAASRPGCRQLDTRRRFQQLHSVLVLNWFCIGQIHQSIDCLTQPSLWNVLGCAKISWGVNHGQRYDSCWARLSPSKADFVCLQVPSERTPIFGQQTKNKTLKSTSKLFEICIQTSYKYYNTIQVQIHWTSMWDTTNLNGNGCAAR